MSCCVFLFFSDIEITLEQNARIELENRVRNDSAKPMEEYTADLCFTSVHMKNSRRIWSLIMLYLRPLSCDDEKAFPVDS